MFALLLMSVLSQAPQEWNWLNTATEMALVAATVVDATETNYFLKNQLGTEGNPLLGSNPSRSRIYLTNAAELLAHAAIAYVLPNPWRSAWQGAWLGIEVGNVARTSVLLGGVKMVF